MISNNYLNLTRREADIAVRVTAAPPETTVGRHPDATVALRCNTLLGLHAVTLQGLGVVSLPCFLAE